MTLNIEIVIIFLLVIFNGLLAMTEIAVVSARKTRLQQMAEAGDANARAALELSEDPNRFLSTIQIGITMVGVFAGAFGGATVARNLSEILSRVPALDPYSDALGMIIVVAAITYLSLVFGELVPKRIGLIHPERIAAISARPMQALSRLGKPLVWLLSLSTNAVLGSLGIRNTREAGMTEEELKVMIEQGRQTGVLEEIEQDMMQRVLRLGDRPVSALMTPRTQIEYLDLQAPLETNLARIQETSHAIFPVVEGNLDTVVGLLKVRDLVQPRLAGKPIDLRSMVLPSPFVPESMPALRVLETFQQTGKHLALVTDEYGVVQGLITLTDFLEGVVGDIPTLDELASLQAVQREDGSWLLDGMLPVHEFMEMFDIEELPEQERGGYQSLGGFIMARLERIPQTADVVAWEGYRLEVVDMDGNRVDKVIFSQDAEPEESEGELLNES